MFKQTTKQKKKCSNEKITSWNKIKWIFWRSGEILSFILDDPWLITGILITMTIEFP